MNVYLGEVSLHVSSGILHEADDSTPVTGLSFRKGSGLAIREALHALAKVAGDIFVFDDEAAVVFVISPEADRQILAEQWPFAP